jgi:hypothetical protein
MSTIEGRNNSILDITSGGKCLVSSFVPGNAVQEALQGWSFVTYCATVTPVGAADYFAIIHNTSTDPIAVQRIELTDAGAETIYAYLGTYSAVPTLAAAAAHAEKNLYVPTNLAASKALIYWDTNATAFFTAEAIVHSFAAAAATRAFVDLTAAPLIIGTNQMLALAAGTGTTAITQALIRYSHLMIERTGA